MALILFESRVNMITAATPSLGGFLVAYDTLDGVLKQKDDQGIITPIGGAGGVGSLSQTLSIGNTTGVNSIYLSIDTALRSASSNSYLKLDGSGENYVELSSSNLVTGSSLTMTDSTVQLKISNSNVLMNQSYISLNYDTNQFLLQNNNSYLKLGSTNVFEFTTATSSRSNGDRVPGFISSNASRFSNTVYNSVIIGGTSIIGTQSNSVYTPNLIIKDGGYVKGTSGDGQLRFNAESNVYLSSGTNIIGILDANGVVMDSYNGIFITDNVDTITTTSTTANAVILSSNTTITDGLTNTVVIGGQSLQVTDSETVYIGGSVDINNQYKLPVTDGFSGQVVTTDGDGNLGWSSGVGTPVVEVTAVEFASLETLSSSTTYKVTNVDVDLYGGTEIYLTTNSQGILNDVGEGEFYNPKYNQAVSGYEIWGGTSSTYVTNQVVYWGGRAWRSFSGDNTLPAEDIFNLSFQEWDLIDYSNGIYYDIVYDKIKYDRVTDKIIFRSERGTNIVSTNSENIAYYTDEEVGLNNPIKVFQWGNVYSLTSSKGIGSQNIVNSYNENINFTGVAQINITMNNLSSQFNMRTDMNSYQDNLILNNYSYNRETTLLATELDRSFQSGETITIDGNLMVKGTTTTINSENLLVKDPIILLAASQSGTPTFDSGLFINRGIGATQAFIWNESADEFTFTSTTSGSTVSGNVSIGTLTNVRTGVLRVGSLDIDSNDRFIVSTTGEIPSLVVDDAGNTYNKAKGITNTLFGFGSQKNSLYDTGISINRVYHNPDYELGTYNNVQMILLQGPPATTYPVVNITVSNDENGGGNFISSIEIVTNGTGFTSDETILGADFGGGTEFYVTITLLGLYNTSFGYNSLLSNSGTYNTGIGSDSLYSNKTGGSNTGIGSESLYNNTTGYTNTGIGSESLYNNTTGGQNSALGSRTLYSNTIGRNNTAVGQDSLYSNTTGGFNTAVGANTLYRNISGSYNSASGYQALYSNTTGLYNTALGFNSLFNNTTTIGSFSLRNPGTGYVPGTYSNVQLIYATGSTAFSYPNATIVVGVTGEVTSVVPGTNLGSGFKSTNTRMRLQTPVLGVFGSGFEVGVSSLLTGSHNTAVGYDSLSNNKTGTFNSALGYNALRNNQTGIENTASGYSALSLNTTGNGNVSIGKMSMLNNTTGTYNTVVGYQALPRSTTSDDICSFGRNSLFYSLTGLENSAFGGGSLYYNTLGSYNTGLGRHAGLSLTTGVASLGTVTGGSNYTPGTYSGVQLKYSSGPSNNGVLEDYPLATVIVGAGGTVSSVTLETSGKTFATSSTIMTSTASIIGPGNGFTVRIDSIQSANNNTAIGHNSLYFNTIGSNNTAIGSQAGSYAQSLQNYISDNSIFIGYFSRAQLTNQTNQIVIGYDTYGNGSNTVTLGNDSIIKTYLKGSIQLPTVPTTSSEPYSILTRNTTTGEVQKIELNPQKTINVDTILDDTYNNAIVKVKTSVNITIPSTLMTNFNCVFRTFVGVTVSFIAGSGSTMDAPYGLKLPTHKMATLFKDGSTTTYILEGELIF